MVLRKFDGDRRPSIFFWSRDGVKWTSLGYTLHGVSPDDLLFVPAPSDAGLLLRGDWTKNVFEHSMDGGRTWARLKFKISSDGARPWVQDWQKRPGVQIAPHFNAMLPGNPVALYASPLMRVPQNGGPEGFSPWRSLGGIYVSHDGGDNWAFVTDRVSSDYAVGVSPVDPRFMMGVGEKGLVQSKDGGRTWAPVGPQNLFDFRFELKGRRKYLTEAGLPLSEGWLHPEKLEIAQIAISPMDQNLIMLRTNIGAILSRDGGQTLCLLALGGDVFWPIVRILMSPYRPSEIYVSTTYTLPDHPAQLLVSKDRGCTFQTLYTARNTK